MDEAPRSKSRLNVVGEMPVIASRGAVVTAMLAGQGTGVSQACAEAKATHCPGDEGAIRVIGERRLEALDNDRCLRRVRRHGARAELSRRRRRRRRGRGRRGEGGLY